MNPRTLAMAADQGEGFEQCCKPTPRDAVLATMEAIVPWAVLCEAIVPHDPRGGNGRPPIGLERMVRLPHRAVVTAANVHDKHPRPELLHGNEQRVYSDSAYASHKALIESKALRARDFTNQRVRKDGQVDEAERGKNRNKSKVRVRVEHVFAVLKRLWGFNKVRYRGLEKNATRSFVALGLANIHLARTRLVA